MSPLQGERPGVVARRHQRSTPPGEVGPLIAVPTTGGAEPSVGIAAQDGSGPGGGQFSRPPRSGPGQLPAETLVSDDGGITTLATQGVELEDRGPQVGSRTQQSEAPLTLGRRGPQLDPCRPMEDPWSLSFPCTTRAWPGVVTPKWGKRRRGRGHVVARARSAAVSAYWRRAITTLGIPHVTESEPRYRPDDRVGFGGGSGVVGERCRFSVWSATLCGRSCEYNWRSAQNVPTGGDFRLLVDSSWVP